MNISGLYNLLHYPTLLVLLSLGLYFALLSQHLVAVIYTLAEDKET